MVEVRGSVHWLTHKDGPARALHVDPAARARLPRVLGQTGQVVWVTDAGGADALEVAEVAGEPRPVRLPELGGTVTDLAASPDGATVAAALHDGRLLAVDVASGQLTELAAGDDGPPGDLSWSPDSAWLAWAQPGPLPLSRIRLAQVAERAVLDVTDGRFADTDPVFTGDGLYLAFLSVRSFDPVYDAQSFDLSFPFGSRPYLVPLAATTPSPFGPVPGGRPVREASADEDKPDSAERIVVTVDTGTLPSRVVGVPVPEARYSSLQPVKGGLAWLREPVRGVLGESAADLDDDAPHPALERFDLGKREVTELAAELDWFAVSGDGTRLVIKDDDELRVVPADSKEDDQSGDDGVTVDLSRARFMADPAALWRHAYAEAGRLMRRDFWVPDMSGVDWDGVLASYRPLLDRIRGAGDFADLLWEVVGELGTSHAYVAQAGEDFRSGGRHDLAAVGQLGADLSRDPAGRWVVDRVLPGESSDPRARSPLAAPGVAVRAGDELVAVDGQPVDPVRGPWPLLAGTAGKPVELTVRSPSGPPRAGGRRAAARGAPAALPGLGGGPAPPGPRAQRRPAGLPAHPGHDGGGLGALPPRPADRAAVRWPGHGRAREPGRGHLPAGGGEAGPPGDRLGRGPLEAARRLPGGGRRGPLVTVTDEFAGSDGDIVTAAIRLLGLGPVVGTRTWGGVIGIDGCH